MPMEDICNFIPDDENKGLQFRHFVYEASYHRLRQPFVRKFYCIHLAFRGKAVLKTRGKEIPLMPGTLFFTVPGQVYSLTGDSCFSYLYISFRGPDAPFLLKKFQVTEDSFVFPGMEYLLDFWMTSIRRMNDLNSAVLAESVLLYSLSFLRQSDTASSKEPADRFESILNYIHGKYTHSDLSLDTLADMFFYNKKYLSALFVRKTGVRYTEYLNNLRVRHAELLMRQRPSSSVAQIASECGYDDPFYFSKVFKKITGSAPVDYLKNCRGGTASNP